MNKKVNMSGNQAAAFCIKQINPDVVAVYPITPSTEIPEIYSEYVANGEVDTNFLTVESEHSAMAACIGASLSSARVFSATSANGLAYMYEMLHIAASMRTSVVLELVTRSISGPLNIHNDHSDLYAAMDTGWAILYAKNNQEVYNLTLIATKIAEELKIPLIVAQDGFKTSHSVENMEILDDESVKKFVGEFKIENNLLDKNMTVGTMDSPDYLFEHKMQQVEALEKVNECFDKYSNELFEYNNMLEKKIHKYMVDDAETIFVSIGSISESLMECVDDLRKEKISVGAIDITMLRPFPKEDIVKAISNAKRVIVVEKAMDYSLNGGYLKKEIHSALFNHRNLCNISAINIYSVICSIGGRNTSIDELKNIYHIILDDESNSNTKEKYYLGLREN